LNFTLARAVQLPVPARLTLFVCLLPLLLAGCIVFPTGTKIISGGLYSREAVAFLNLPDATRQETISTLGPPTFESKELGVLLYIYQSVETYHVEPIPIKVGDVNLNSPYDGQTEPETSGLFVGYDDQGRVTGHGFSPIGPGPLEVQCTNWVDHPGHP
jgi:hypothetical protein